MAPRKLKFKFYLLEAKIYQENKKTFLFLISDAFPDELDLQLLIIFLATFDFGSKDIVADIVKAEEENMTENQQRLEDEYQQMS